MRGIPPFTWRALSCVLSCAVGLFLWSPASLAGSFDWIPTPTDEEIQKYRKSWNPLSHGPMLISSPDIQPRGQWYARPLIFSQIGTSSFGNRFETVFDADPGPVHLYSAQLPFFQTAYGLTDHVELGAQTSFTAFWAREDGKSTNDAGWGDTSFSVKYRPIVQDPDSWVPTINWFNQVAIPTGKWAGTDKPPGGFSPIGRFPSTRFGEVSFTTGLSFRKNTRPFRWSGGVFYTYSAPGLKNERGEATYSGDLINTRLVFEHILNDKRGFGYSLEFVTLHGLTSRLDGHTLNAGRTNGFSLVGVEPSIQWRIGDTNFLAAGGVLFTLAGQNAINAIYPNISVFYYWSKSGKVMMR